MEKHIKEFIEEYIQPITLERNNAVVIDGEIVVNGVHLFDSEIVGYYCVYCKKKFDFVETDKLEEHITEHLPLREYFVYVKKTFRINGFTKQNAIDHLASKQSHVDFKIDNFNLEAEMTDEDTKCEKCGKYVNDDFIKYANEIPLCPPCYNNIETLNLLSKSTDEGFICDRCDKQFPETQLCNTGNEEDLSDYCVECFKKIGYEPDYKKPVNPIKCHKCGKLSIETRYAHNRPHCGECYDKYLKDPDNKTTNRFSKDPNEKEFE